MKKLLKIMMMVLCVGFVVDVQALLRPGGYEGQAIQTLDDILAGMSNPLENVTKTSSLSSLISGSASGSLSSLSSSSLSSSSLSSLPMSTLTSTLEPQKKPKKNRKRKTTSIENTTEDTNDFVCITCIDECVCHKNIGVTPAATPSKPQQNDQDENDRDDNDGELVQGRDKRSKTLEKPKDLDRNDHHDDESVQDHDTCAQTSEKSKNLDHDDDDQEDGEGKEEVKKVAAEVLVRSGLENLGASCYLNALLQSLGALGFGGFDIKKAKAEALKNGNVLEISNVFKKVDEIVTCLSSGKLVNNSQTRECYILQAQQTFPQTDSKGDIRKDKKTGVTLYKRGQQDAHECLMGLMDKFPKEVQALFKIEVKRRLLCDNGHVHVAEDSVDVDEEKPARNDASMVLSLAFAERDEKKEVELQALLKNNLQAERLLDFRCGQCSRVIPTTSKPYYGTKKPQHLILHLKRFYDFEDPKNPSRRISGKINTPIKLTPSIDIDGEAYSLKAIVYHRGSLNFGHYTAHTQHGGEWFYCDDSSVIPESSPTKNFTPYMLFYSKAHGTSGSLPRYMTTDLTSDSSSSSDDDSGSSSGSGSDDEKDSELSDDDSNTILKADLSKDLGDADPNYATDDDEEESSDVSDDGSDSSFICEVICEGKKCGKAYTSKNSLKRHQLSHAGSANPYRCPTCDKGFSRRYLLTDHLSQYHKTPYTCGICDSKTFILKKDFDDHVVSVHAGIGRLKFKCDICAKKFSVKEDRDEHKKEHIHDYDFGYKRSDDKSCTILTADLRKDLGDADPNFTSGDDGDDTVSDDEESSDTPQFTCKFVDADGKTCRKSFNSEKRLKYHEIIHTDRYLCPLCPDDKKMRFRDKSFLNRHLRTHTGERPYKCQYCSKRFIDAYVRRAHERTHTDKTPYKCQYCDKRFIQKSNCVTHERRHTGEKPYKCQYCSERFPASGDCKSHISRVHLNERNFPCRICGKRLASSRSRKYHEEHNSCGKQRQRED